MKTSKSEPDRRLAGGTNSIHVKKFRPDFENSDAIPRKEAARIVREKLPGIWFINPIARVHADTESPQFLQMVAERQAEWFRHLSRQLKNGWRTMRNQTSCAYPSWNRAYAFDGIVVSNLVLLPYAIWMDQRSSNPTLTAP